MASLIARRCKHSGVPEQFDSYIEIPSGQPGARTNKRGSCKSCRKETSLTLARMAAHFLEKKGHGVSVCTVKDSPVAAALATEADFDTVKITNDGVLTKRAREAAFSQQTIPFFTTAKINPTLISSIWSPKNGCNSEGVK